jgi:hypothetical protein
MFRYAPCNPVLLEGEALALAAANRSAAFYQMKQYQQAIEDIGQPLTVHSPVWFGLSGHRSTINCSLLLLAWLGLVCK